jgi:acetyl-CoA C-acetyltransferase
MTEAWIIDAARIPRAIGRIGKGAYSDVHPQRLLSTVLSALAARNGFDTADVDDVIAGCNIQQGKQGSNIARMAALDAGWDLRTPGLAVHRFCGSGLSAVSLAAMGIMSGMQQLVAAGGVESMSHGSTLTNLTPTDGGNPRVRERHHIPRPGMAADLIAAVEGFSRAELDALALESQGRADAAIRNGWFAKGLTPFCADDGSVVLDREEYPRPQTTAETLAQLKPAFAEAFDAPMNESGLSYRQLAAERFPGVSVDHVHHAGNSSGIVDGAGAVLLASPDYARAHGLKPRAKVRAISVAGDDPTLMLNAPAPAARKALKIAGMAVHDIDLFEVNEAFAVVPLKFMRELDLDPAKVNVNGGAIALGHPIGATGAILLGTLLDELERRDLGAGLVTLCANGAMAPAMIIERTETMR